MDLTSRDRMAIEKLLEFGAKAGISTAGGTLRRSSSRFCFGVEHGDYNGTDLFGVGTDRFIWLACKPSSDPRMRLYSGNFPDDGVIEFSLDEIPSPGSHPDSWGRFPCGAAWVLKRDGFKLDRGMDAVIYGDIPGGGMSRSASLTLNLILSLLEANEIGQVADMKVAKLAQAVENDYIGSPCGLLDQVMILFSREGFATLFCPADESIEYIPLGAAAAADFRLVILDTGTVRPGLEKSTYAIRRAECEEFVSLLRRAGHGVVSLADIKSEELYRRIVSDFAARPELCSRLKYIFSAQERFYRLLEAWKAGRMEDVGAIFRADGIGLRDEYMISGPELETMCDIARTVPGVYGERMLGGGDKGASGAIVSAAAVDELKGVVDVAYPRSYPHLGSRYAVHTCEAVDGITLMKGLL